MAHKPTNAGRKPYIPLFLGILEHQRRGLLPFIDHSIYVTLHGYCDFETGICIANATEILRYYGGRKAGGAVVAEENVVKNIQNALVRLRKNKFINYPTDMSGNLYPILIHKYWVRTGPNKARILDAFAPGSLENPIYVDTPEQLSTHHKMTVNRAGTTPSADGGGLMVKVQTTAQYDAVYVRLVKETA